MKNKYLAIERRGFLKCMFPLHQNILKLLQRPEILDVIDKCIAYQLPIKEAAVQDFIHDWGAKKLSDLVSTGYEDIISKDKVNRIKNDSPKMPTWWNKRMDKLVRSHSALYLKLKPISESDTEEGDMLSGYGQIEKEYLPKYKIYRMRQAKLLQQEYELTTNFCREVFDELQQIIANKGQLGKAELQLVIELEQNGIENAIKQLYDDLDWSGKYESLITLRQSCTTGQKNTACFYCGKTLYRSDSGHYCKQRENRKCVEVRQRIEAERIKQFQFILERNRCVKCGKDADYFNTHKEVPFCSNRCYESYRKSEQRGKTIRL